MMDTTKRRYDSGLSALSRDAAAHWIIRRGQGLAYEPGPVGQATSETMALSVPPVGQATSETMALSVPVQDYNAINKMVLSIGLTGVAALLARACQDRAQSFAQTDGVLSRKWGRAAVKASELAFLGTLVGGKE